MTSIPPRPVGHDPCRVAVLRLGAGLGAGIGLGLVFAQPSAWSHDHPSTYAMALLIDPALALVLLAGIGHMRARPLLVWALTVCALVALLTRYLVWRRATSSPSPFTEGDLGWVLLGAAALYVAHHLVEPAVTARRWRPPYPAVVEAAWRHGFQLALALAFAGVAWGTLELGGALFGLIGIGAVGRAVETAWVGWPVMGVSFAAAVQLTDARPGLIAGLRALVLTLLSWLLVPASALVAAFLLALLFTGLGPLWATARSASLLLGAAALLIVLVNAACGDGLPGSEPPPAVRWAARLGAACLLPLAALAGVGVELRVVQHGLTPSRVYAVAAVAIVAVYAVGYLAAAASRRRWMGGLGAVNVAAAGLAVAAVLLLMSPALDPARLSVADQMRRIPGGTASREDIEALRYDMARFGIAAVQRLAEGSDARVAALSRGVLYESYRGQSRWEKMTDPGPAFAGARVVPEGASLPAEFRQQGWTHEGVGSALCLVFGTPCTITPVLDPVGATVVVVHAQGTTLTAFSREPGGRWSLSGTYDGGGCPGTDEAVASGSLRAIAPPLPDLDAGGVRLSFTSPHYCRLSTE